METDEVLKLGKDRICKRSSAELTTEDLTFLALMKIISLLEPVKEEPKAKKIVRIMT
jgi:hypothetical protein